jgi:hypothetical protein
MSEIKWTYKTSEGIRLGPGTTYKCNQCGTFVWFAWDCWCGHKRHSSPTLIGNFTGWWQWQMEKRGLEVPSDE